MQQISSVQSVAGLKFKMCNTHFDQQSRMNLTTILNSKILAIAFHTAANEAS